MKILMYKNPKHRREINILSIFVAFYFGKFHINFFSLHFVVHSHWHQIRHRIHIGNIVRKLDNWMENEENENIEKCVM